MEARVAVARGGEAEVQGLRALHAREVLLRDDVPGHRFDLAVLDPEDLPAHGVQEDDVVGHDDRRVRVLIDLLLEPLLGGEVQVVRRLVQQQKLGLQPQGLGQFDLHAPTSRQLLHGPVDLRSTTRALLSRGPRPRPAEAQGEQDATDLVCGALPSLQLALQLRDLPVGLQGLRRALRVVPEALEGLLQRSLPRQQLGPPGVRAEYLLHCAVLRRHGGQVLAHQQHLPRGRRGDAAFRDQAQQGALPATVRPDDAVARAAPQGPGLADVGGHLDEAALLSDGHVRPLEEAPGPEEDGEILCLHRVVGCLGRERLDP
mmetsp:Transcript_65339/g.202544  ORF Transcript_65339/g.202544 Transcript_65339/m.202544 type:complete len:316 (-) Transcript_65339:175-1122(-)